MQQALRKRHISGIKRGSYYRVLGQARTNIKKSLFTVALAVRLGLVNVEDVQKLIVRVSSIPEDLDPAMTAEILAVLQPLAERIVMA